MTAAEATEIAEETPVTEDTAFADAVIRQAEREAITRAARRMVAQQEAAAEFNAPALETLDSALARPRPPVEYRIEDLMVIGHNTSIAATYKIGKTTLLVNRVRSYVDGAPFLGQYDVRPLDGRCVVFNFEVGDHQFLAWLQKAGIRNTQKVAAVNLRGLGFFLQDDAACEWAVKALRQMDAEVWEIDPLSAAIRGNTNSEEVAQEFLVRVDKIKAEAGVKDLVLTSHTGHLSGFDGNGRAQNERTSGSARFMGWPDSLWTYTRDQAGTRYLSATGRDVDVPEFALEFNNESLALYSKGLGTGRTDARSNKLWGDLLRFLRDNPDSRSEDVVTLGGKCTGATDKGTLRRHRDRAVEYGLVESRTGDKAKGQRGPAPVLYSLSGYGTQTVERLAS